MKEKMKAKGKISDSGSDGEDDEFAEFMRWKQQKRKAQVKILTRDARHGTNKLAPVWNKNVAHDLKVKFSNFFLNMDIIAPEPEKSLINISIWTMLMNHKL